MLFLGNPSLAQIKVPLPACLSANFVSKIHPNSQKVYHLPNHSMALDQTVFPVAEIDGIHGGSRILERRTGSQWKSGARAFEFDPQGDPRYFIAATDEETGYFFGTQMINGEFMTTPTTKEAMGAIAVFNKGLPEEDKIAGGFFELPSEAKPARYAHEFGRYGNFPMATQGVTRLHDITYHLGTVLIPPKILNHVRKQVSIILDFENHLLTFAPDLAKKDSVKKMFDNIYESITKQIDIQSARYISALADDQNPGRPLEGLMFVTGGSPQMFLVDQLDQFMEQSDRALFRPHSASFHEISKTLKKDYYSNIDYSEDQLLAMAMARLDFVKARVRELLNSKSQ